MAFDRGSLTEYQRENYPALLEREASNQGDFADQVTFEDVEGFVQDCAEQEHREHYLIGAEEVKYGHCSNCFGVLECTDQSGHRTGSEHR